MQPPQDKTPRFIKLKSKWQEKHGKVRRRIEDKHQGSLEFLREKTDTTKMAAGTAGGVMLLLSPAHSLLAPPEQIVRTIKAAPQLLSHKQEELIGKLKAFVPGEMRNLNADEEWRVAEILSESFGVNVAGEVDGKRLNRTYGIIGAEQHLYRYPGDTLAQHADNDKERKLYIPSGIAPGLGAWGYFAPSKEELDEESEEFERYYLAVQTFLSDDFNKRFVEYRDFYKYRKMVVVNPDNGKAVVAVIADAGPAVWTGKHLGGSPEVMQTLGLGGGPRKGPVLYFFVNDPKGTVPLGPIKVK